jgi:hypothetical protein
MASNIIEAVCKHLNYAPLEKVDPNIQEIKENYQRSPLEKLAQAAVPAVLAAIYKLTRTKEGCSSIIDGDEKTDWLSLIYHDREKEAAQKVAQYAEVTSTQAESHMENIAEVSISVLKEAAGGSAAPERLRTYMNSQRHNILVHLPAALQLGDTLNDEAIDDRTNKMEGPVSNMMHRIENTLSKEDETNVAGF